MPSPSEPQGRVLVKGWWHVPECLVARHPDPGTWDNSGFPWCTCPKPEGAIRD